MFTLPPDATPKVHPASREILPDDPLHLHGHELPGDPDVMLRVLVEEFARMGFGADQIITLACDPQYQAFAGLRATLGEDAMRRRIGEILARCGVLRTTTLQRPDESQRLVSIDLPA